MIRDFAATPGLSVKKVSAKAHGEAAPDEAETERIGERMLGNE